MSPQETHPLQQGNLRGEPSEVYLESEFLITGNGFLPSTAPLAALPDRYYEPWETIAQYLPALLREGALRNAVDSLPVLSVANLRSEPEWRRAYLILCFLTHAYVWGGEAPSDRLPPQVALPLLGVSRHLDLPPVATYSATNLWNFTSSSSPPSSFSDLDSLQSLLSFTGTKDESWFYMISVAMECEGGHIIPTVLSAMRSIEGNDGSSYVTVAEALEQLMACIRRVGAVLDRMHDHCEPDVFYHAIRPFLAGSKNMAAAGLPNGVFYDEGDGKGQWRHLRGGSNGQSSLIQFFDIVLGVEHAMTKSQNSTAGRGSVACEEVRRGQGERKEKERDRELPFHEEVRAYMPGPHRRFLEHLSSLPNIRRFALQASPAPLLSAAANGDENARALMQRQELLRNTFQKATAVLTEFRSKHLRIVTRYIVLPSRRRQQQKDRGSSNKNGAATGEPAQRRIGLAGVAWREPPQNPLAVPKDEEVVGSVVPCTDSDSSVDGHVVGAGMIGVRRRMSESRTSQTQLTGTGGTALMPFLKQFRDETARAGRLDDAPSA